MMLFENFQRIFSRGGSEPESLLARKNELALRIAVIFIALALPYIFIFQFLGLNISTWIVIFTIGVFGISAGLNQIKWYSLSKTLLVLGPAFSFFLCANLLSPNAGAQLLLFTLVPLPLLLFEYKQWPWICFCMSVPIAAYLLLETGHYSWLNIHESLPLSTIFYIRFSAIITTFLLLILSAGTYSKSNNQYETKIEQKNSELEEKNLALEEANIELIEKAKTDKDLAAACLMQMQIIPTVFPQLPGITIDHYYQAARKIGGDYIDGIELPDGRILVFIMDIVGKGVQASLKMSMFYPVFQGEIRKFTDLETLVKECNQAVHLISERTKHIPCLFGVIDAKEKTFAFINAGHEPGYVIRNHELIKIDGHGFPLGMDLDCEYEINTVSLNAGDRIVLYTDGFTDIQNHDGERFDPETLTAIMQEIEKAATRDFVEILVARLMEYKKHAPQADDMALISIKINH